MRIRWRDLELPTKVVADSATRTDSYAKFTAEPFERGYGVTVGNGLRRVLLSSIEGTAVTSVKIQGVKHEFSSIDGIKEDVTDIILALKRLRVQFHTDDPKVLRVEKSGAGPVTGADIMTGSDCEVVSGDLHICTITEDNVSFEAEIEVRRGRGYVTAEENAREEQEIGVIPVDSIFSPIQRVRYRTENTRVGKLTNYDRLILELWTDGTITPEMALVEASKIYRKHLNPFIQFFDVGKELLFDKASEPSIPGFSAPVGLGAPSTPSFGSAPAAMATAPAASPTPSTLPASMGSEPLGAPLGAPATDGGDSEEQRRKLELPIAHLDLSVRASNCLEAEGVQTIGELVRLSQEQLMGFKNFGRTSLKEITRKLDDMNLSLGMEA
ncbi:MAG: DNA-directed RNA polymerase subunit alpha [Planctomycetota bacterium]|nr:DNA-directed RNA polymerase subunit alpha [Planctomycetota bacterium]